jgi:hypothetical protein
LKKLIKLNNFHFINIFICPDTKLLRTIVIIIEPRVDEFWERGKLAVVFVEQVLVELAVQDAAERLQVVLVEVGSGQSG